MREVPGERLWLAGGRGGLIGPPGEGSVWLGRERGDPSGASRVGRAWVDGGLLGDNRSQADVEGCVLQAEG